MLLGCWAPSGSPFLKNPWTHYRCQKKWHLGCSRVRLSPTQSVVSWRTLHFSISWTSPSWSAAQHGRSAVLPSACASDIVTLSEHLLRGFRNLVPLSSLVTYILVIQWICLFTYWVKKYRESFFLRHMISMFIISTCNTIINMFYWALVWGGPPKIPEFVYEK